MNPVLHIEGIGVCAAGLADWEHARAVLSGAAPFVATDVPRPVASALPSTERRRANAATRWALQAASEAVQGVSAGRLATLSSVFASSDGDGEVLATVLRDLAQPEVRLSPTTFHNSVYNAPAGYWSIAAHASSSSTTLCAGAATFAAGLLEAAAQVAASAAPVLLVAYDHPFPADSPIVTDARAAFACALLLAPANEHARAIARIDRMTLAPGAVARMQAFDHLAGNAAAAALPLLRAVVCHDSSEVALPYVDDTHLLLRCSR
jgi:hypothetical protein